MEIDPNQDENEFSLGQSAMLHKTEMNIFLLEEAIKKLAEECNQLKTMKTQVRKQYDQGREKLCTEIWQALRSTFEENEENKRSNEEANMSKMVDEMELELKKLKEEISQNEERSDQLDRKLRDIIHGTHSIALDQKITKYTKETEMLRKEIKDMESYVKRRAQKSSLDLPNKALSLRLPDKPDPSVPMSISSQEKKRKFEPSESGLAQGKTVKKVRFHDDGDPDSIFEYDPKEPLILSPKIKESSQLTKLCDMYYQ